MNKQEAFDRLLDNILNPAPAYSAIPFWFLNDTLEEAELERQLRDFRDKGIHGVVVHPRIGIPTSLVYLSDAYFRLMRFIVQTASSLDMQVVLYDEAMYPSGSAHGRVVYENPDYASIGITFADTPPHSDPVDRKSNTPSHTRLIAHTQDGRYIIQRPTGGTIRGIHFGEDDGEANAPPSADLLNPAAVQRFIELTHEQYYAHLSDYFGTTIIGFFTDEPCIVGRNAGNYRAWTNGLGEAIEAAGGKLSDLDALFYEQTNDTTDIYHAIVRQRMNDVYYRALSEWCQSHGIALMGHPESSDDIDEQIYFHVPGQDLIMRRVSPEHGSLDGIDSVQAKCAADVARHLGRRRNSNECFGVCAHPDHPWHLTASDMKWFIDWLGVRGVNLFIPHAFYYSIRDTRKNERPPDVGPNNIWWPHYGYFANYMKRLSYLMTDSFNRAKVAIFCKTSHVPHSACRAFFEHQIEFNYLNLALLDRCESRPEGLGIGAYTYPYYMIEDELEAHLSAFEPLLQTSTRIRHWHDIALRDFIPNNENQPYRDLRVTHLTKDGFHLYLFSNEGETRLDIHGSVPCHDGMPILIDLWSSDLSLPSYEIRNQRTHLSFALERRATRLIAFAPSQPAGIKEEADPDWIDLDFMQSSNVKIYQARYDAKNISGKESFSVSADEMVECYCNGTFVGVSFWNPHSFKIAEHLIIGLNTIELHITGSAANDHGADIPFGLSH